MIPDHARDWNVNHWYCRAMRWPERIAHWANTRRIRIPEWRKAAEAFITKRKRISDGRI